MFFDTAMPSTVYVSTAVSVLVALNTIVPTLRVATRFGLKKAPNHGPVVAARSPENTVPLKSERKNRAAVYQVGRASGP